MKSTAFEFMTNLSATKVSLALTILVAGSSIIESMFKVKFIGAWIMSIVKTVKALFVAPFTILKAIEVIKAEQVLNTVTLASLENEIKYNGGKYTLKMVVGEIKDAVEVLKDKHKLTAQLLRASLYVSTVPTFITDAEGRLTFINAAWARMIECSAPQEMMGFGWLRVIPEEDVERVLEQGKMLRENPTPYSGTLIYKNWRTGEKIETYCRSTVVLNENGKLVETIGALEIKELQK